MNNTKGLILHQKFPSLSRMQQGVGHYNGNINRCICNKYNCAHHNIFVMYKRLIFLNLHKNKKNLFLTCRCISIKYNISWFSQCFNKKLQRHWVFLTCSSPWDIFVYQLSLGRDTIEKYI